MTEKLRLAISTCPNDTFAFHGLIDRKVDWRGLDFDIYLGDVQELNEMLFSDRLDIAKASFHAALHLSDRFTVFSTGSALGFGVGPLLLSARPQSTPDSFESQHGRRPRVLCPGQHTTATMLYQLFYPGPSALDQVVFSEIMPALREGRADFGVCIHEGRFTWQDEGLHCVEDLGSVWEKQSGCPLPLGGILGRRELGSDVLATVQAVIGDSLQYGLSHRDEALSTMRRHAQEFDDAVLFSHVELYVNEWTSDLGVTGKQALDRLHQLALDRGLISPDNRPLDVIPST